MSKRWSGDMGLGVLFIVLLTFGLSWGQPTMLVVVRAENDTLWKMTCVEEVCSSWANFPGQFRYQPTVTWDETAQEWVIVGTSSNNSIWMATFDKQGNFNNDWQSVPGSTPSPAGVSSSLYKMGGDIKTDRWLNSDTNTFIGVGVAGAGHLTHSTGTEGWYNTALGYQALFSNATGYYNAAIGSYALHSNTTGYYNTANGSYALHSNTTGSENTATGLSALFYNTTGSNNTATGHQALLWADTGSNNTATGHQALNHNSTGFDNTATGLSALNNNTGGDNNTATGLSTLALNTTGYQNAATGSNALYSNTTGSDNTATGSYALYSNTTGNNNTAIGYYAGYNATTGSYNIFIGAGVSGTSSVDHVIRIGGGQTQTYIAGISGASIGTSSAVYVNGNGQLGTITSSRRFKEDIQDMREASSRLMKLRPVTFHYKPQLDQEERVLQYGLIAEEVAEVYPELVQYGQSGEPLTVRYHELGPMLLNEVQRQQEHIDKQEELAQKQHQRPRSSKRLSSLTRR